MDGWMDGWMFVCCLYRERAYGARRWRYLVIHSCCVVLLLLMMIDQVIVILIPVFLNDLVKKHTRSLLGKILTRWEGRTGG
jgi:hypothetical protein